MWKGKKRRRKGESCLLSLTTRVWGVRVTIFLLFLSLSLSLSSIARFDKSVSVTDTISFMLHFLLLSQSEMDLRWTLTRCTLTLLHRRGEKWKKKERRRRRRRGKRKNLIKDCQTSERVNEWDEKSVWRPWLKVSAKDFLSLSLSRPLFHLKGRKRWKATFKSIQMILQKRETAGGAQVLSDEYGWLEGAPCLPKWWAL